MSDFYDRDEPIDSGWWDAQMEADARHESEFGPAVTATEPNQPWKPDWVRLRDRLRARAAAACEDPYPVDILESRFGIREESA